MIKNPTKVGAKNASRNNVLDFGSLNLRNALFIYLKVKVMKTANKTGINSSN